MRRKQFYRYAGLLLMISAFMFSACTSEKSHNEQEENEVIQTYTCPMHPQIIQNTPGVCPVCSMDLVPFDKNSDGEALTISDIGQALANISTIEIGADSLTNSKQLNGRLVVNPEQTSTVSSRVSGRVDRLFVRELGVPVSKGQPLYQIYSEQLSVLQREYLLSIAQVEQFPDDEKFKQIEQAAKQKLLLYNQTPSQVRALEKNKKVDKNVTFFAPESGTIAELSITEGQYVEEGSPILRIDNYSNLWVEADLYSNEVSSAEVGQQVKVVVPGWEDQPQHMIIQFINPSLQSGSQLLQIRGTIPNPNGKWQVGQQVNLFLPTKSKGNVFSLPVDAVIRTGRGAHVWIETQENTFESRMVQIGMENFDHVEIVSGLKKGDKVVVTGTYLLNSEYILKKGSDPMAAHNH